MAIFMPLDNNLNFNNILKFQTPTQIFHQLLHKEERSEENFMSNSNFFGNSNAKVHDVSRMMSEKKHKSLSFHLDVINNHEDSCNSTDSDLSVGQEKIDDDKSDNNNEPTESEAVEKKMSRNALADEEEDNSSNASSSRHTSNSTTLLRNPQNSTEISENAIQMSILRPNPSRMQEEIFRNSQLYAEELVRQQLAAAARLQSLSASKIFPHIDPSAFNETQRLVLASHPETVDPSLASTLNFQSCVFNPKTIDNNQNGNNIFCNNKSAINFQNIHSHLSAISQITNNLTSSIKKDDSTSLSSLSRESSQSPSNFQHLKQHHHQNMIFHTHQNQLHERNLKFSIDNILKADFGRRITEPLLRSSKSRKALREGKAEKESFKKFSAPASMKETFASRDENPRVPESSPPIQSPTSTDQSKSENNSSSKSSGSGSGTVWPAWVNKKAHFILTFLNRHSNKNIKLMIFNFIFKGFLYALFR